MKKPFEGQIHEEIPADWDALTRENPLMNAALLTILKQSNPNPFRVVTHAAYCCCESTIKMNLFTFSRFKCNVKLRVIALPVSLCAPGYVGDLHALIRDYKRRKGLFLVLNIEQLPPGVDAAVGETLGNCIFDNRWSDFGSYLASMKSGYRRRINIALKKAAPLCWRQIEGRAFTDEIYRLYLNVFHASKYPLECLAADFFRLFPGEIFCLYDKDKPLAFVLLKQEGNRLSFLFGGMDYRLRDQYDLYMNMLIFLVKTCIARKCSLADLGQTAEESKLRVGATLSRRHLCIFSGNRLLSALLTRVVGAFSYKQARTRHALWKTAP